MKKQALCMALLMAISFPALSATQAKAPSSQIDQNENSFAPTQADMEKARADKKAGRIIEDRNKTRITEVRDNQNQVVEYVVDPASTHIKYRIENQLNRPIDTTPGSNSRSTLGTTKFIQFGW